MDEIAFLCLGNACNRLPSFVSFSTSQVAAIMQLMDRLAGASFFIPTGLNFTGAGSADAGLLTFRVGLTATLPTLVLVSCPP